MLCCDPVTAAKTTIAQSRRLEYRVGVDRDVVRSPVAKTETAVGWRWLNVRGHTTNDGLDTAIIYRPIVELISFSSSFKEP